MVLRPQHFARKAILFYSTYTFSLYVLLFDKFQTLLSEAINVVAYKNKKE